MNEVSCLPCLIFVDILLLHHWHFYQIAQWSWLMSVEQLLPISLLLRLPVLSLALLSLSLHSLFSFYSELWQAWSQIVHMLIPNVSVLEEHLSSFAAVLDADEVLLFERATFLVSTCWLSAVPGVWGKVHDISGGLGTSLAQENINHLNEIWKKKTFSDKNRFTDSHPW